MKLLSFLICAGCLLASSIRAQSPVTLTIGPRASSAIIQDDFIGLSFGMKTLLGNKAGGHFFSATNAPLITLFQNLGIRHLRVGGTTVESPPATPIPDETDVDNLFGFVRAAGVKHVIYSLRLLQTDPALQYTVTNAAAAKYIWNHYRSYLECFAIGNEPDRKTIYDQDFTITNFASYLDRWRIFASAITNVVPEAKFAGPDAGSGNVYWTTHFAGMEKNSGLVEVVTEHFYSGGAGRGLDARQGIEAMLSRDNVKVNQALYDNMAAKVLADSLPFRFTEANDHYSGGVHDASDTFAGALWALDFLHWWAAHDAKGVDFHNTQWVVSDIITPDATGRLTIYPKSYGLKAFDLGGHGNIIPMAIANPQRVNLTAYAVRGAGNLFVTIINKDHGVGANAANVKIVADGILQRFETIFLTSPDGDVTAKSGVTLGGASISSDGPWLGKWTPLEPDKSGHCVVKVPATSAVIVKIAAE
jgi:hypothetical protein